MLRFRLLFALFAVSLFFNTYLLARSQGSPPPEPASMLLSAQSLDLTADQALGLESVRRFAEIRWQRRDEQRVEPLETLRRAVVDPETPPEVVDQALEELGIIDAQYRYRLFGELSKWSAQLGPVQRARLNDELSVHGLEALVPHWE